MYYLFTTLIHIYIIQVHIPNSRLGSYVYLEDGSTAGKFFCLPHSGEIVAFKLNERVDEKGSDRNLMKEDDEEALGTYNELEQAPEQQKDITCINETDPDERKEKENVFTAIFTWFGVAYEGLVAACK